MTQSSWRDRCNSQERAARNGWAEQAAKRRWTLWVTLSFAQPVSETAAVEILTVWAAQLKRNIRGAAVIVGIHTDTNCLHAHALVFIPRRFADPYRPPGVAAGKSSWEPWLQARWALGAAWAREYDSALSAGGTSPHGAAAYLARDPGTVVSFGTAPLVALRATL